MKFSTTAAQTVYDFIKTNIEVVSVIAGLSAAITTIMELPKYLKYGVLALGVLVIILGIFAKLPKKKSKTKVEVEPEEHYIGSYYTLDDLISEEDIANFEEPIASDAVENNNHTQGNRESGNSSRERNMGDERMMEETPSSTEGESRGVHRTEHPQDMQNVQRDNQLQQVPTSEKIREHEVVREREIYRA